MMFVYDILISFLSLQVIWLIKILCLSCVYLVSTFFAAHWISKQGIHVMEPPGETYSSARKVLRQR